MIGLGVSALGPDVPGALPDADGCVEGLEPGEPVGGDTGEVVVGETIGDGAGLTAGGDSGEFAGGETIGDGARLPVGDGTGLTIGGETGEKPGGTATGELGPGLNEGAIGGKGDMLGGTGTMCCTDRTTKASFCPCVHRSPVPLTK